MGPIVPAHFTIGRLRFAHASGVLSGKSQIDASAHCLELAQPLPPTHMFKQ